MRRGSLFFSAPLAVMVLGLLMSTAPAEAVSSTGWGVAELIETDNAGYAYEPAVAVDGSGNVVAVWRQSDGTRYNIWANRYVVGTGWGVAGLIETDTTGDAIEPAVAIDASGDAVAVWEQWDGIRYNIWANRYVVGTGWGVEELIEIDNAGHARAPVVSVDGSGNAVAVWEQYDGIQYNIYANRYVVGTGWVGTELIETDNTGHAFSPTVAADNSGDAVAVWYQSDGTRNNMWANRYVAGTGWGEAELIESDNNGSVSGPEVAVDASGNVVAVWEQDDSTRDNIWANRYVVGTGWGEAELIETDNAGDARYPAVAVDASGNGMAVWQQSNGTRDNIWANRYVVGTGWGEAELIETGSAGDARYPVVAVDVSGNGMAVWHQSDGIRWNIYANRYVVGAGWGEAELIETENAGSAFDPVVGVDDSGNVVAVWRQHDGTRYNIWANRYVAPDVTPPSLILSSPTDDTTTDEPLIIVSGTTEPGATVSANGVLAAVLDDGSFSCTVTLEQGSNTIVVTATDDSGNSATLSRTVVYNDPLIDLTDELGKMNDDLENVRLLNLVLVVALVVVGALAAVSLAMYLRLKKMMSSSDRVPVRMEPPPPPGG